MSAKEAPINESQLISHISEAGNWYRHAEIIVQQRLYNFLMAASILVLAAATSLSASPHNAQKSFIVVVSIIGFTLSLAYAILGLRQVKFIDLHMNILQLLEAKLQNPEFRVITPIAALRTNGKTNATHVAQQSLNKFELKFRASLFLYMAPFAFSIVFAAILYFGIAYIPSATVAPSVQINSTPVTPKR